MTTANQGLPASDAQNNASTFTKTYNSFSGVDMVCTFGKKIIGELQGISYTVQREKAPIYTMGSADPRSFSRGKRGIAGSVVFHVFDRSALLEVMRDRSYIANAYDLPAGFKSYPLNIPTIESAPGLIGPLDARSSIGISRIVIDKVIATPQYLDQVLPFDITITASNEYGSFAKMMIHGVEILNCGSGMSIDDITTDEACTFVATRITPWNSQGYARVKPGGKTADIIT